MISYLQSKFAIPYFLEPAHNPILSSQLDTCFKQKKHVELFGKNLVDLKRQVLHWEQTLNKPLIWLRLDALDSDPGRFWTVFVYGLRKHYPTVGHSLLNGIMDFHASPNPQVFHQFQQELEGKPFILVMTDCRHIQHGPVKEQLANVFKTICLESMIIFLHDCDGSLFKNDIFCLTKMQVKTHNRMLTESSMPIPQHRNLLSVLDTWWICWLKRRKLLPDFDLIQYVETMGEVNFLNKEMLMPSIEIRYQLRDLSNPIDYDWMSTQIRDMTEWLIEENEWLEAFRWLLFIKDFETAGDLLETHGLDWLSQGGDTLTLLFWLRELPSVLLTARPLPAYLAAKTTFLLGLKTQSRFYLTSVQNSLEAMARFSHSPQQLLHVEVTNGGLTYQDMVTMVDELKGSIEETNEI